MGLNFFFSRKTDSFRPLCVKKGAAFVYYEQISLFYRPCSRSRSTAHTLVLMNDPLQLKHKW